MPLIKLGYLLVRTIAKPISSIIKKSAKNDPKFRQICLRVAQIYHQIDVRCRRNLASRTRESNFGEIRPLNEQKAIELGSNFIGEAIIFGIAGTILFFDIARSSRTEAAKKQVLDARIENIYEQLLDLTNRQQSIEDALEKVIINFNNSNKEEK